jgi:hypothetical protein
MHLVCLPFCIFASVMARNFCFSLIEESYLGNLSSFLNNQSRGVWCCAHFIAMSVWSAVAHIKLHDTGTWWRFDDEEAVEMGLQPTSHPADHGTTAATATAAASAGTSTAAGSAADADEDSKPAEGGKKRSKGGAAGATASKRGRRGAGRGSRGGGRKGKKGGKKEPWEEDSEADAEAEAATAAAEAAAEQDAQLQQALQMSLLTAHEDGWVSAACIRLGPGGTDARLLQLCGLVAA